MVDFHTHNGIDSTKINGRYLENAPRSAITVENSGTINTGDATTDTIIGNMRTRIAELEDALQALNLLR